MASGGRHASYGSSSKLIGMAPCSVPLTQWRFTMGSGVINSPLCGWQLGYHTCLTMGPVLAEENNSEKKRSGEKGDCCRPDPEPPDPRAAARCLYASARRALLLVRQREVSPKGAELHGQGVCGRNRPLSTAVPDRKRSSNAEAGEMGAGAASL